MKRCNYYNCTDYVEEILPGFQFCEGHELHLKDLMEYDVEEDADYINSLAFLFSALNAKAYKTSVQIL